MMRALLIAASVAITSGCVGPAISAGPPEEWPRIAVAFYGQADEPIPYASRPRDLDLVLGPIAGRFFGDAKESWSVHERIGRQESIRLNMHELTNRFNQMAKSLEQAGLQVNPHNTRFARVATFAEYRPTHKTMVRTGFVDAQTGEGLTLMFFDRPCQVTGTIESPATDSSPARTEDFHLKVGSDGFVWLTQERDGTSHGRMSVVATPHVVLVVAPPENHVWPDNRERATPEGR